MVIYEVNLKIKAQVFKKYMQWLAPHIEEILKLPGFIKAIVLEEHDIDTTKIHCMSIQYHIDTMEHFNNYLSNHAQTMRDDGLKIFPNQFSATRRIFKVQNEVFN